VRARATLSSESRSSSVNLIARATRIVSTSHSLYDAHTALLRYL
jgi:hypothetical protein